VVLVSTQPQNQVAQEGWKSLDIVYEGSVAIFSRKETDGGTLMAKVFSFTTKHYPVNDLLALDLQDHLDSMATLGWELVSTQQLINEHSATTPQLVLFWGKNDEG